jgi:hypothetical protein
VIPLSRSPEGGVDLGRQEIEVELVRRFWIERTKSESFPPPPSSLAEGGDDDGSACCGGPVDSGHRNARVGHDNVISVSDHPRGSGVAPTVLARVSAQPLIEDRLSAVELVPIVSARVKRRRPLKLSQAS